MMLDASTALPIIGVLCLFAILFVADFIMKVWIKFGKKNFALKAAIKLSSNLDRKRLAAAWAETEGSTTHFLEEYGNLVIEERLNTYLQRYFSVELVNGMCSGGYCNYIYRLTSSMKNVFFIQLNANPINLKDGKGRPRYFSAEEPIVEGESIADGVSVLRSSYLGPTHSDVINLETCLAMATVERIQYVDEKPNSINVVRMMSGAMGYMLKKVNQSIHNYNVDTLQNRYSPVKFTYSGEEHEIPMNKALPIMISTVTQGENIAIFGQPGVGKSSLANILYREITKYAIAPIILTTSLIKEWADSGRLSSAIDCIRSQYPMDTRIVFIIDEAETLLKASADNIHTEEQAVMLQLLSGDLKESLNCTTILIFNAKPELLNPAIFRGKRIGLQVELKPLSAISGLRVAEEIRVDQPDLVFDKEKFNKLCNAINTFPNGQVYADRNEITLADIYTCFQARDIRRQILEAIRAASGKPMLTASRSRGNTKEVEIAAPILDVPKTELDVVTEAVLSQRKSTPKGGPASDVVVAAPVLTAPKAVPKGNYKKPNRKQRRGK